MRHAVCHCLCLLCLALLTHCEEHDNSTEEHHHPEGPEDGHEGHDHSSHEHDTHAERAHHPAHVRLEEPRHVEDYRIWLAASGSILLISLCGIFGVIVIPIMQRVFYQHLIQFLIALAVGTLAGDALLHLLPHAILARLSAGGGSHEHDHEGAVWLGFTAAAAMLGFFFFEKVVSAVGGWREGRARARETDQVGEEERKLRVVREGHVASDRAIGEKVCKHKYSTYCAADFEPGPSPTSCAASPSCARATAPAPRPAYTVRPAGGEADGQAAPSDHDTVIISEHEVAHHGHSHAHSHVHSAPENISSVAWMVIFGDGIHNLADGLAIGAAFADGAMSGFSTSVAVLCHELPHEIGDFAMLLKAGMTIKQAIFYNVLSSVLAFLGMVVGLSLGNLEHFSSWMFAATAGIFLYVALVDMMPELSSGHAHPISRSLHHEGQWLGLLLQLLGMSLGVSIMLLIALYEHDLRTMFGETDAGHQH